VGRAADGALETTAMAMGKFSVGTDANGQTTLTRNLGADVAVLEPRSGQLDEAPRPETRELGSMVRRLRAHAEGSNGASNPAPIHARPPELDSAPVREERESFTYLNTTTPARWFEPDSGTSIPYAIDSTGDAKIGPTESRAAVNDAFAAWA